MLIRKMLSFYPSNAHRDEYVHKMCVQLCPPPTLSILKIEMSTLFFVQKTFMEWQIFDTL